MIWKIKKLLFMFFLLTIITVNSLAQNTSTRGTTTKAEDTQRSEIINSLRLYLANTIKDGSQTKFRVGFLEARKDDANVCVALSKADGSYFDIEKTFNLDLSIYDNKFNACMNVQLKRENESWKALSHSFLASTNDRTAHNRPYYVPKLGSPERKEILDSLGNLIKTSLKARKAFRFDIFYVRIKDEWAFVSVGLLDPEKNSVFEWKNSGVDLSQYRLSKDFNTIEAFLKRESNRWQVVLFSFNSDSQRLNEECRKYNCPPEILEFYIRTEPNF